MATGGGLVVARPGLVDLHPLHHAVLEGLESLSWLKAPTPGSSACIGSEVQSLVVLSVFGLVTHSSLNEQF